MKGFSNLKLQSVLIFSRCKFTMMLNSSLSNKLFSYHLYLEEQAASATVQEAKAAAAATRAAAASRGTISSEAEAVFRRRSKQLEFVLGGHRFLSYQLTECSSSSSSNPRGRSFPWPNSLLVATTLAAWLPGWLVAAAAPPSEDAATIVHSSNTAF